MFSLKQLTWFFINGKHSTLIEMLILNLVCKNLIKHHVKIIVMQQLENERCRNDVLFSKELIALIIR